MSGFLVVLTFMAGMAEHQIQCSNMACVEWVRRLSAESAHLARLRVYPMSDVIRKDRLPVFAPIIDEWRS